MSFLPALLGALVGGGLALIGGVLADLRARRGARADRVRLLLSDMYAEAIGINGGMSDVVKRSRSGEVLQTLPDRVRDLEYKFTRASGEAFILVGRAPLRELAEELAEAMFDIIYAFGQDPNGHEARVARGARARVALMVESNRLAKMSPRSSAAYFRGGGYVRRLVRRFAPGRPGS